MTDLPKLQSLPQIGSIRYLSLVARQGSSDLSHAVERLGGIEATSVRSVGRVTSPPRPVTYHPGRHVWTDGNGRDIAAEIAATLDDPLRQMARRINGEMDLLVGIHRRIGSLHRPYLDAPSWEAPVLSPPLRVSRAGHQAWLTKRLEEWTAADVVVPDPVRRRVAFVLNLLAQLPRPDGLELQLLPASTERHVVIDLHLSDNFARSPMRVAVEDHRLVLDHDSMTAPKKHRLDIALTHAFALAAGYGLLEFSRDVVVEVRFLMGSGTDEPRDPNGRVRIGGSHWPEIVEEISSSSLRELERSATVDIELAEHVT